ncbi:MAG: leucine-rich repeat protein [Clostridia bacterium]|nr:leucine-rich repeat protein [Clostridia bacterium]
MKRRIAALILAAAMTFGIHSAAFSEGDMPETTPAPAPEAEVTPTPAAEPTPTPEAEEVPNMEQDVTPSPEVSETPAPEAEGEPTPAPSMAVGAVPTYLSGSETIVTTGSCGTQATYTLYGDGKLVISGKGSVTSAPWLSTVNGVSYKLLVTAVVVEEGITSLEKGFQGCTNLASITMPASVTALWTYVFQSNSLIKTAGPIGGGYDYEFAWADTIAEGAFKYIGSLESVVIPEGVTTIAHYALMDCAELESVSLPSTLSAIGNYVFSGCSSLTSVTFPEAVSSIGSYGFDGSGVTTLTFLGDAPAIGTDAFKGITATAYYDSSRDWTADDRQQYGGTITWVGRLMGDADEDGSITVLDAILVAKHAASLKTLTGTAFEKADVNGDGALTAADAVLISAAAKAE